MPPLFLKQIEVMQPACNFIYSTFSVGKSIYRQWNQNNVALFRLLLVSGSFKIF